MDSPSIQEQSATGTFIKVLHYGIAGVLIFGGLAYWYLKPSTANPMADPQAAKAMAMVQTHQAIDAPTLRQSLASRVKGLSDQGKGVRLGEWQVEHVRDSQYLVRIWLREEGTKQWFEREYVWRVDLEKQVVIPMSNFSVEIMPRQKPSLEADS